MSLDPRDHLLIAAIRFEVAVHLAADYGARGHVHVEGERGALRDPDLEVEGRWADHGELQLRRRVISPRIGGDAFRAREDEQGAEGGLGQGHKSWPSIISPEMLEGLPLVCNVHGQGEDEYHRLTLLMRDNLQMVLGAVTRLLQALGGDALHIVAQRTAVERRASRALEQLS